jgi:hypothetical protein
MLLFLSVGLSVTPGMMNFDQPGAPVLRELGGYVTITVTQRLESQRLPVAFLAAAAAASSSSASCIAGSTGRASSTSAS